MQAMNLSTLAYKSEEEVLAGLAHCSYAHWFNLKHMDIQGFFFEGRNQAGVVIRGTTSLADWLNNLDVSFTNSAWGEVHSGFKACAEEVMKEIGSMLFKAKVGGKQIIFTGHSLGGAVATQLFADYMFADYMYGTINKHNNLCIPIEAPRNFSKEAAELFGQCHGDSIYPVIHNNDIVPRMPPTTMGYADIPNTHLQYINSSGKVVNKISLWDRLLGYLKSLGKPGLDSLEDHDLSTIQELWHKQL